MRIALLGSALLLDHDDQPVRISSRRQRQLLAALGSRIGRVVSSDELVDWLWDERPPADPVAAVQTLVSRLRRTLAPPLQLVTEASGYCLHCPQESLDADQFEDLVLASRSAAATHAVALTSEALALWRGVPFVDIDHPDFGAVRTHYEALRLEAVEIRVDALVELDRHSEAIALAEPHVRDNPERERPVAALMRALYADGRQTEALAAYRELRDRLIDDLGVDPSPELRELEMAVLRQDPDLSPPPSPPSPRSSADDDAGPAAEATPPRRLEQRIRFCGTADGVRIALATSGTGPPLVKAANWMTHLDYDWESPVWRHWLHGLSQQHELIRYDERGCGLSDWYPDRFDFDAWVDDLAAIVDYLELERFPLLGISQGGAVALAYAVRHPERVSHLVLWGAYGRGRLARAATDEQRREALMHTELARIGWGNDDPAFRQVFTAQFMPDGNREQWEAFNELQRRTTSPENAVRFMEVFAGIDVIDLATEVQCPVLIMHSRDEVRVPATHSRELAALIPDSRFVPLPSRNHILMEHESAWQMFVDELTRFVRDQP
ncbi:MAG: alpha/beta fold hydrolase [Actinomycetota bacterium]|nr:alpha/beta fold hydrolase [Actinomycetota bacterium]